jgi:hypothetical protein
MMRAIILILAKLAQRFLELGHTGTAERLIEIAKDEQALSTWMKEG